MVPVETPDTTPLDEPIVATVVVVLLHTPPVMELLSVVVLPTHKLGTPVIEEPVPTDWKTLGKPSAQYLKPVERVTTFAALPQPAPATFGVLITLR